MKFFAYGWSSQRSFPAIRDQVIAALSEATHTGWDGLLAAQRAYLDGFWERADVELEGDTELQQAVRFGLFHTLQAGARAEQRAIAAKGLTGPGYDGHTFWDTERFVLPVLTYTEPDAARDALRWRHVTLDLARERAKQLGLEGAAFPWRTIRGQECSGYWPAGTAAFHIGADIADAVQRYYDATEDDTFDREIGLELLVETARLWRSLGHHDPQGQVPHRRRHRSRRVQRDRRQQRLHEPDGAAEPARRRRRGRAGTRGDAADLDADFEEAAAWRDAARDMVVPWDDDARRSPAVGELHEATTSGTSSTPRPTSTRCSCTSRTSTSTASRSSSRPISCSRCTCAATRSPTRRRCATSSTTSG